MCTKWIIYEERRFSLQSLLVMIKRLKTHEVHSDKEVIECHCFIRLVLIQFIIKMIGIVHHVNVFEWHYDYKDIGLKRDDDYWKQLFLSSKSDDFNRSTV